MGIGTPGETKSKSTVMTFAGSRCNRGGTPPGGLVHPALDVVTIEGVPRPSPKKLSAITTLMIATPGTRAYHQYWRPLSAPA